ncbi:MAG TPA: HU family DNA-binding protein [Saprospiraceae bacterium]|nr:HU family DNA-binding protein [Saprospiraceae bacterium]
MKKFCKLDKIAKFAPLFGEAFYNLLKIKRMRKADLVSLISDKSGVPKVDVLVSMEMFFKEVKNSLAQGENVYIRGFGSFIVKKRAKKIGRHIKKNVAIEIPEHFIPSFKPAKVFVDHVKLGKEPEGADYDDEIED